MRKIELKGFDKIIIPKDKYITDKELKVKLEWTNRRIVSYRQKWKDDNKKSIWFKKGINWCIMGYDLYNCLLQNNSNLIRILILKDNKETNEGNKMIIKGNRRTNKENKKG